jgi:hypothetical protein
VEIDGHEALSHALDINGLYALWNHNQRFFGHPFMRAGDYNALLTKNFTGIRVCPPSYGFTRVCYMTFQKVNELVVWAGAGREMGKEDFLDNAKRMFEGVADDVMFSYHIYEAELCMQK